MFFQVNGGGEKLSSTRCYQKFNNNELQHCLIVCINKFTTFRNTDHLKRRDNCTFTQQLFHPFQNPGGLSKSSKIPDYMSVHDYYHNLGDELNHDSNTGHKFVMLIYTTILYNNRTIIMLQCVFPDVQQTICWSGNIYKVQLWCTVVRPDSSRGVPRRQGICRHE